MIAYFNYITRVADALGVEPGPRMGVLLQQIYERQLDGEIATLDDGLAVARRLLDAGDAPP